MKESFWGYWIIVLGIFVIIIMMLISNVTTTNTQDYYLIKNVTEAAMVDAIDYSYYRQYQELKINREKFIENFLRRFAENVSLSTYTIDFYGIYEAPPKVSVKVTTKSATYSVMGDSTSFDIVNKVDAILETSGTAAGEGKLSSGSSNNSSSMNNNTSNNSSSSNNSNNIYTKPVVSRFKVALYRDISIYYDCWDYASKKLDLSSCKKRSWDWVLEKFEAGRLSGYYTDKDRALTELKYIYDNEWPAVASDSTLYLDYRLKYGSIVWSPEENKQVYVDSNNYTIEDY